MIRPVSLEADQAGVKLKKIEKAPEIRTKLLNEFVFISIRAK